MKGARLVLLMGVTAVTFLASVLGAPFFSRTASGQGTASPYAGSEACFKCHPDQYNAWAAQYAKGIHSLGKRKK